MKGPVRAWPAQSPSDDFAERVVRAALAERGAPVAEATELSSEESSIDAEVARWRAGRWRLTRAAWAMVALLVIGVGIGAAYIGNRQREARGYAPAVVAAVASSPIADDERVRELGAKQRELEAQQRELEKLQVMTLQEPLKTSAKARSVKEGAPAVPAAARPKAASSAGKASKQACRCPPGDSLCSCL